MQIKHFPESSLVEAILEATDIASKLNDLLSTTDQWTSRDWYLTEDDLCKLRKVIMDYRMEVCNYEERYAIQ
jgi:hypothetical protein